MEEEFFSGAVPRTKDKRDILLGKVQSYQKIPDVFMPDNGWLNVNYQGKLPTCGAYSATHLKSILEHIETRFPSRFCPRYSWIKIKGIDNRPLADGTDICSIMKSIRKYGVLDWAALLPDDVSLPLDEYSDPSIITTQMDENANPKIISSYGFIDYPDFDDIKQSIYQNNAVLLLIRMDKNFWHTQYPVFVDPKYGHFVVADGFDTEQIRIIDSSESDPSKVIKFVNKKYIVPKFFIEGATAVDLENWKVTAMTSNISILRNFVKLLQSFIIFIKVANK